MDIVQKGHVSIIFIVTNKPDKQQIHEVFLYKWEKIYFLQNKLSQKIAQKLKF